MRCWYTYTACATAVPSAPCACLTWSSAEVMCLGTMGMGSWVCTGWSSALARAFPSCPSRCCGCNSNCCSKCCCWEALLGGGLAGWYEVRGRLPPTVQRIGASFAGALLFPGSVWTRGSPDGGCARVLCAVRGCAVGGCAARGCATGSSGGGCAGTTLVCSMTSCWVLARVRA